MPSLEPLRQYEESVGRVRNSILELREMASGGRDLVRKHCQFLREDIEIAAESRIEEARKLNDDNDYYGYGHKYRIDEISKQSGTLQDQVTAYEEQRLSDMD